MLKEQVSKPRLCVWFLVPVLLVSFYIGVVPSMELVSNVDLVRSVKLYGHGRSPAVSFEISSTVTFHLDSDCVNWYSLVIRNQTCDVFSGNGALDSSKAEICVALYPPTFHAKSVYSYCLRACAFNFPLWGVTLSDTEIGIFSVNGTEPRLQLNATYDGDNCELGIHSLLVNGELEPIVNQTVGFYLQPNGNDTSLPDRGYVALGSVLTDSSGQASLSVGCNIGSGCHKVQARFECEGFESAVADAFFVIEQGAPFARVFTEETWNGTRVSAILTDKQGWPLSDKLVFFRFQDGREPWALTDVNGTASVWFDSKVNSNQIAVTLSIAGDKFTKASSLTTDAKLISKEAASINTPKKKQTVINQIPVGLLF